MRKQDAYFFVFFRVNTDVKELFFSAARALCFFDAGVRGVFRFFFLLCACF